MPVLDLNELDTRTKYHKPTEEKVELHEKVRGLYTELAKELNTLLPSGSRESDRALTFLLDDSLMAANAAIARRG